jgi:late competence protein required for DNA uptake (superfamily II DNA/RNA helicase)
MSQVSDLRSSAFDLELRTGIGCTRCRYEVEAVLRVGPSYYCRQCKMCARVIGSTHPNCYKFQPHGGQFLLQYSKPFSTIDFKADLSTMGSLVSS